MATQTLEQFGQTIKQKYPQYKDISDTELGQKMLDKYPQYKDMVSSTPASDSSPKTGGNFLNTAEKVVGAVFPGRQVGKAIGTLAGYGITKAEDLVKGTHNAQYYDLSAPSPLQVAGDVAKGTALIAGLKAPAPVGFLNSVAQGAEYGALSGAGQAATQTSGKPLPNVQDLKQIGKGGIIGGAIGGIISGATSLIGSLINRAGDKITTTAIKPTKADIEDGFSLDTIKKHDLGGSLSSMYDKTESKMADLTQQLNDKLAQNGDEVKNLVDMNNVYKDTVDSLSKGKLKSFGSNASMENALAQLKSEVANVSDDGMLTIPQSQLVKQASGKFGAWQYGVPDPESSARQVVYNTFYNKLKTAIEEAAPDGVKEINKQISELIPVQNAIIRRIPVAERNSALSLSDMVTLAASMLNPSALVTFGMSLAQKEASMGNILSKLGPQVTRSAPVVGQLFGNIGGRFAQPPAPTQ